VRGAVVADDLGFLHRMVLAGAGIGLLPETSGDPDVERGALARVLPGHAMRGGAIYVVSPPLRHVPARVALLREHLIAELPRVLRPSR
jgi:DNA-binding transcriptional LysR family regulator